MGNICCCEEEYRRIPDGTGGYVKCDGCGGVLWNGSDCIECTKPRLTLRRITEVKIDGNCRLSGTVGSSNARSGNVNSSKPIPIGVRNMSYGAHRSCEKTLQRNAIDVPAEPDRPGVQFKKCFRCSRHFTVGDKEQHRTVCGGVDCRAQGRARRERVPTGFAISTIQGRQYLVGGTRTTAVEWLENLAQRENTRIWHAGNVGELIINYKKDDNPKQMIMDGYCETTNTVYELRSDYWDGNPETYPASAFNVDTGTTFGQLYWKAINREAAIRKMGYNYCGVWESEVMAE